MLLNGLIGEESFAGREFFAIGKKGISLDGIRIFYFLHESDIERSGEWASAGFVDEDLHGLHWEIKKPSSQWPF